MKTIRSLCHVALPFLLPLGLFTLALATVDPSFGPLALALLALRAFYCLQPGLFGLRFDYACLGVDPAGTHTDGGIVFGSQVVTINSVAYIADDIDVKFPVNEIERKNEVGVPVADALVEQAFNGTMTLQLAASTTPLPPIAGAFTITSLNSVSLSCKVKEPGVKFSSEGEAKVNVSFKKKFSA